MQSEQGCSETQACARRSLVRVVELPVCHQAGIIEVDAAAVGNAHVGHDLFLGACHTPHAHLAAQAHSHA